MIKVINFPFCNYSAVARMLNSFDFSFSDLVSGDSLSRSDTIILPGVGSFLQGMSYLYDYSLNDIVLTHAQSGGKIIAICLGLQLLFSSSDESPGVQGLNYLDGKVVKIPHSKDFNVPHVGWNSIHSTTNTPNFLSSFFDENGLSASDFYFVHSFYALPSSNLSSIATVMHPSGPLDIAFRKDNVFAFQFHPEKSGPNGYEFLKQIILA